MYKSVKSDPKAVELLLSPCNINKDEDEDDNGDHQGISLLINAPVRFTDVKLEVKLWPRQKRKIEDTKINSEAAYKKAKVEGIADDVIYVERLHADTITEGAIISVFDNTPWVIIDAHF
jgi:hypothetical protein